MCCFVSERELFGFNGFVVQGRRVKSPGSFLACPCIKGATIQGVCRGDLYVETFWSSALDCLGSVEFGHVDQEAESLARYPTP